jgi:hypothetical protein
MRTHNIIKDLYLHMLKFGFEIAEYKFTKDGALLIWAAESEMKPWDADDFILYYLPR